MIAVVQRVRRGRVTVAGEVTGVIDRGFVVLLGVKRGDQAADRDVIVRKIHELRVFEDAAGRMNLSLDQVDGKILLVPQFTLLAGLRRGRRPDFLEAAEPEEGRRWFDEVAAALRRRGVTVETGRFGAHMLVEIENDGPATFLLDSRQLLAP